MIYTLAVIANVAIFAVLGVGVFLACIWAPVAWRRIKRGHNIIPISQIPHWARREPLGEAEVNALRSAVADIRIGEIKIAMHRYEGGSANRASYKEWIEHQLEELS